MSNQGLWVNETTFLNFAENPDRAALTSEIASRQTAWDFSSLLGLLPDPDPVLTKHGSGAEILDGLTADDHVTSVIQTRKVGTLQREIRWQPGALKGQEPDQGAVALNEAFAADMEAIDNDLGLRNVVAQILDAPFYGYTPLELTWVPEQGRIRLVGIEGKPHAWFKFNADNQPRYLSQANPESGEEIPWGKIVFARHFPTYKNPYGLRLLSRCFWPVTFKRGGMKFWVTFCEKYGIPFLLGRYPRGTGATAQKEMLSNLAAMIQDAVAVVPEGSTVELLGAGGNSKGSSDLFDRLVSVMDKSISKVIVGQTLTAETSDTGGAYAQSKTHENVLEAYQASDQALVKETFDRIAALYAAVNAHGVAPPQCSWFEEDDPQQDFATRDKTLTDTGQVTLTKTYYVRRYGFADDEIEVAAPSTPQPETAENAASFAEAETRQPGLDDLITAKLAAQVDPEIAAMVARIRELMMSVGSLPELRDRLLELYPAMPTDKLAEAMSLGLTGATLAGHLDVRYGAD